jgi:nickel/cobalt transporter (NiCoT) family protein
MTHPTTSRAARGPIAATMALLILANALCWAWAWRAFHGHPTLLGTALLAWVFGLRHAVDADHIAAIDNVVRKLVQSGRRAWDGGLFFALGHSTTVLLLCLGIIAVPSVHGIERLRDAADAWGTLFSAVFLLLIGMANLLTLRRLWRARHGGSFETTAPGGVMSRILGPVQRLVGRTWHMLPVGFLFGLGFDTASEVALLALTAQQAAAGLSAADLLIFPAMFAAGMVLIDTADSAVMTRAYGWALREPGRKLTYNIAVTALSVCVALGVGGLELLGLLAGQASSVVGRMPLLDWMLDVMGSYAGFVVVALLLLLWGVAVLGWRSRVRLAN